MVSINVPRGTSLRGPRPGGAWEFSLVNGENDMRFKDTESGLMAIRPEFSEDFQVEAMNLAYKVIACVDGNRHAEVSLILALGYWVTYTRPRPQRHITDVSNLLKETVASNLEAKRLADVQGRGGGES